ncbi:MAG: hypothetical protein R3185_07515 [Candidatus Thermoplasmatota archaeon]|nr:hypothetical protein [Candidatus Thermoplasmatota archaeon]
MMIKTASKDLSEPKTLKVSLPTKLHLQLHQIKILTGTSISDTVTSAVQAHLEAMRAGDDPAAEDANTQAQSSNHEAPHEVASA